MHLCMCRHLQVARDGNIVCGLECCGCAWSLVHVEYVVQQASPFGGPARELGFVVVCDVGGV